MEIEAENFDFLVLELGAFGAVVGRQNSTFHETTRNLIALVNYEFLKLVALAFVVRRGITNEEHTSRRLWVSVQQD